MAREIDKYFGGVLSVYDVGLTCVLYCLFNWSNLIVVSCLVVDCKCLLLYKMCVWFLDVVDDLV